MDHNHTAVPVDESLIFGECRFGYGAETLRSLKPEHSLFSLKSDHVEDVLGQIHYEKHTSKYCSVIVNQSTRCSRTIAKKINKLPKTTIQSVNATVMALMFCELAGGSGGFCRVYN